MQHIIKERDDIIVARSGGPDSVITKEAKTEEGRRELSREHAFLIALADTGHVPKVYGFDLPPHPHALVERIVMEDVGDSHEVTNEYDFHTDLTRMLYYFRAHGVIHGDLTSANIRIVDNRPVAIDWGESRFVTEDRPAKRPEGDTWHAWNFASQLPDGSRVARRWFAIYNSIAKHFGDAYIPDATLLDVGCFHGDIAAAACAAGMNVYAIDVNPLAIDAARARWSSLSTMFTVADATIVGELLWRGDVVTILSVYPYIVKRYGDEVAKAYLSTTIKAARMVFFECQLAGDGPGPSWMVNTNEVQSFLKYCGGRDIEAVCEIELPDRDTTRTVFKVIGRGGT